MKAHKGFRIGKFIILGVALVALATWAVMLLWNWLVPELLGGPVITYWQSLGILVLSKILFTGLHGKPHSHDPIDEHSYWRRKFIGKLSPETREKMKARWEDKMEDMFGEERKGGDEG